MHECHFARLHLASKPLYAVFIYIFLSLYEHSVLIYCIIVIKVLQSIVHHNNNTFLNNVIQDFELDFPPITLTSVC